MKIRLFFGIAAAVFSFAFAGCKTTTVPVSYAVPPTLDMSGIKRVAIVANYSQVTDSISQKLTEAGKTIASHAELQEWRQWERQNQEWQRRMDEAAKWNEHVDEQERALAVAPAELVDAFQGNAVRADSLYGNKLLRITGVVNQIGKSSSSGSYFARLTGKGNDGVDLYFLSSELDQVSALNKGQTITVIGICLGYTTPGTASTDEIAQLLGGGRPVNINDVEFQKERIVIEREEYSGPIDAVITATAGTHTEVYYHRENDQWVPSAGSEHTAYYAEYQILHARDISILKEGETLSANNMDEALYDLLSAIGPMRRSMSVDLAKPDNSKAKKDMKAAEKLVKEEKYADAAAAYGKVYAQYKNFAAGYNQALTTEAAGNISAAISLMEALAKETGDSRAQNALQYMQNRNASTQKADAQLSE